MTGDFNMVEKLRNRKGGNINNTHLIDLKALSKLKNDHNLLDPWWLKHRDKIAFTYHDKYYTSKYRIDRIYVTQNVNIGSSNTKTWKLPKCYKKLLERVEFPKRTL